MGVNINYDKLSYWLCYVYTESENSKFTICFRVLCHGCAKSFHLFTFPNLMPPLPRMYKISSMHKIANQWNLFVWKLAFLHFFQEYSFLKDVDVEPENSESCKSVHFNIIMLVQGSECYRCKDRDIVMSGSDTLHSHSFCNFLVFFHLFTSEINFGFGYSPSFCCFFEGRYTINL